MSEFELIEEIDSITERLNSALNAEEPDMAAVDAVQAELDAANERMAQAIEASFPEPEPIPEPVDLEPVPVDKFAELRGLTAEEIRKKYTKIENKAFAKALGVSQSGNELAIAKRIVKALATK